MQQQWIHENVIQTAGGYISSEQFASREQFTSAPAKIVHGSRPKSSLLSPLSLVLTISGITVLVGALIIAVVTRYHVSPQILPHPVNTALQVGEQLGYSKSAYLAALSNERSRHFAGRVHYVSSIITETKRRAPNAQSLAFAIVKLSDELDYDPLFVTAVIKYESTFNTHARSPVGALGLMQLMPGTGRYISKLTDVHWSGTHLLKNPEYNIRLGISYLKYLDELFDGNKEHVLIAYNWGPSNLTKALRKVKRIPGSTSKYARRVLQDHQRWSARYAKNPRQFQYFDISSATDQV